MNIFVNDECKEVLKGSSLSDLICTLGLKNLQGWAIALNSNVVPQENLAITQLADGDRILLIQATQGG
jgi:thiamine biosynthesis protein ThiS